MGKKLYVGNLTYGVTDSELEAMFAAHGSVQSAQVIMDRDTGRSKGFGFVEMGSDAEAQAAIAALNGTARRPFADRQRSAAEGGRRRRWWPRRLRWRRRRWPRRLRRRRRRRQPRRLRRRRRRRRRWRSPILIVRPRVLIKVGRSIPPGNGQGRLRLLSGPAYVGHRRHDPGAVKRQDPGTDAY